MMISRAIVVKMLGDKCRVSVPSMSNSEVDAYVCTQKGVKTHYIPGDVVFIAWLDETNWLILGHQLDFDTSEYLDTIKIETAEMKNGILGETVRLGSTGISIINLITAYKDLYSLKNKVELLEEKLAVLGRR